MSKIANSFLFILKSQMTLSLGAWGGCYRAWGGCGDIKTQYLTTLVVKIGTNTNLTSPSGAWGGCNRNGAVVNILISSILC